MMKTNCRRSLLASALALGVVVALPAAAGEIISKTQKSVAGGKSAAVSKPSGNKEAAVSLVRLGGDRFRMVNNTRQGIVLHSYFPADSKEPFAAKGCRYEYLAEGKWVDIPYGDDGFVYDYVLGAGKSVVFEVSGMGQMFEDTPKGTMVRIKVRDYISQPFRW